MWAQVSVSVSSMNLQERLEQLEGQARRLEVSPRDAKALIEQAGHYAAEFVAGLDEAPTYVAGTARSRDWPHDFPEQGSRASALIEQIASQVDHLGINPASGGHMGYIPGGGIYPSAVGDFLADVGNRYAGVEFASPGAVQLERSLVRWMTNLVGYPDSAGGDLTSGGSIANLTGLVTAREAKHIQSKDIPGSCIYLTGQAHHCVDKALRVAGLS